MCLFGVAHPTRTRAREHRELALPATTTTTTRRFALTELPGVLEEGEVPRKGGVVHVREAEHVPAEDAHPAEDLEQGDVLRGAGGDGRGERGERLGRDGDDRHPVVAGRGRGVVLEEVEDFGVRLHGDEDGLGGGDASAAFGGWTSIDGDM